MGRISFTDDTGRLCWFDPAAAKDTITEGSYWDGNNWRGVCSRLQTSRAVLYLTSGSRWVENADARCEDNGHDDYLHFTDEEAQAWLIRSADAPRGGEQAQAALKKYFGDIPEESGPGRPEIGGTVNTRLGDLLPRIDEWAERHGVKRAEAIREAVRRLVSPAIESAAPTAGTWLNPKELVEAVRTWGGDRNSSSHELSQRILAAADAGTLVCGPAKSQSLRTHGWSDIRLDLTERRLDLPAQDGTHAETVLLYDLEYQSFYDDPQGIDGRLTQHWRKFFIDRSEAEAVYAETSDERFSHHPFRVPAEDA